VLTTVSELRGCAIHTTDGDLGHVDDVFFDDRAWSVRYFVIQTGQLLHRRRVLLDPAAVSSLDAMHKAVDVRVTRVQLERGADADAHMPVSRWCALHYRNFAAWPVLWVAGFSEPQYAIADPRTAEASATRRQAQSIGAGQPPEPHLRSAAHVTGHHVIARDGELGHVSDFVVDDEGWSLCDVVVESRHWLHTRQVELATYWIDSLSWAMSTVQVDLTRERALSLASTRLTGG
jgi:uncharacterized protein YrrD